MITDVNLCKAQASVDSCLLLSASMCVACIFLDTQVGMSGLLLRRSPSCIPPAVAFVGVPIAATRPHQGLLAYSWEQEATSEGSWHRYQEQGRY